MKLETNSKTFILLGELGLDSGLRAVHKRQWVDSPKLSPPVSVFETCLGRTGCPLDTVTGACVQVCNCNQIGCYSSAGVYTRDCVSEY